MQRKREMGGKKRGRKKVGSGREEEEDVKFRER